MFSLLEVEAYIHGRLLRKHYKDTARPQPQPVPTQPKVRLSEQATILEIHKNQFKVHLSVLVQSQDMPFVLRYGICA